MVVCVFVVVLGMGWNRIGRSRRARPHSEIISVWPDCQSFFSAGRNVFEVEKQT